MGCVSSKPDINDRHPNIFQVTNVNDQGKSISSGQLEVTENELVLYQRNKEPTVWPLRSLRKYGFDAGIFSFECGRRCPTGQGIYAFHCRKAEQLFNIVQHNIQRNSNDETITTTAAGGGSNNASSTAQQQMAAQTGGGDFPVPQNSTGPPVISRRSIPASMTTTVSQQQQQQTGPEVYLSPVAAVVNSVRPTPIPPAAAHSQQQQQQHPTLSRPGSMIANNAGGCGGPNSPTSLVAMTTATPTVISPPPPVLIGGNGCNNNNNNNNNNNSTNNNLIATTTQQLHFTGTTTTVPSSTSTVINDTNNDVSLLALTTEHNNNINPSNNSNNKKSLVSVAPSVLPAPELYHHQYTNTAGVLSGGILSSSSLSYFDAEESLSSPPPLHQNPPSSPPAQPALIQQLPQQVNYANLGLTNAIVISSSTNNNAHNGTAAGGVVLNEDYMNMLDSPCHVYMNVETGGGVAGTNPQTTHVTKEPTLTALPASSTTNFSNNGMVETRDLLVLNNGGSKEKLATGNHVNEIMQEPIMAELKSEPEEYELEDDTPSHSYANIDAKDFEHLRPLLLSHRNNSLAVDSMMGFASSSAIPGLMTNSGSSSNSVPQTPTSLYNVTTSQMGSCHQEYYSTGISATNQQQQHEVNYAELDLDCKNHNFFGATTKSPVAHPMTSQDHQDFPSSPVLLTQKSPDGPAPDKIEQKKSYATIDFQKTNALSQSVNPHNVDIIEEGSRKTRHNSTISDVTNVATTGGGRHSSSLSD